MIVIIVLSWKTVKKTRFCLIVVKLTRNTVIHRYAYAFSFQGRANVSIQAVLI